MFVKTEVLDICAIRITQQKRTRGGGARTKVIFSILGLPQVAPKQRHVVASRSQETYSLGKQVALRIYFFSTA